MIGDPSGTSAERNLLDRETLEANLVGIRSQLERFLSFEGPNAAVMVNNLDWLSEISMIEFLRDVGKHFTIPYMLAKDSVQTRLGGGLSFTEFSYMLLQAADFRQLYRTLGVELQMGGADQWGNITAGLELIGGLSAAGGQRGRGPRARVGVAAARPERREVRQDRGRHVRLARRRSDDAVRVLPVLARPGRRRGRPAVALLHAARPARDRGAGREQATRPEARPAQRALALEVTAASTAGRPRRRRSGDRAGVLGRAARARRGVSSRRSPSCRG